MLLPTSGMQPAGSCLEHPPPPHSCARAQSSSADRTGGERAGCSGAASWAFLEISEQREKKPPIGATRMARDSPSSDSTGG